MTNRDDNKKTDLVNIIVIGAILLVLCLVIVDSLLSRWNDSNSNNSGLNDTENITNTTGRWESSEHCLVWGGVYDRSSLVVLCVDFVNQSLNCNWEVQPNNDILIWTESKDEAVRWKCTKKVEARKWVPNEVQ